MFIRFDRIHERDGRTDRHADTQTPHDGIGCAAMTRSNDMLKSIIRRNLCRVTKPMIHSSIEMAMAQPVTAVTAATAVRCVEPTHTYPHTAMITLDLSKNNNRMVRLANCEE